MRQAKTIQKCATDSTEIPLTRLTTETSLETLPAHNDPVQAASVPTQTDPAPVSTQTEPAPDLRANARNATHTPSLRKVTEAKMNPTASAPKFITAVFPQNTMTAMHRSLSDSSDTTVSSVSAPLKGKHFIWTC